jgi:hypothetical protein
MGVYVKCLPSERGLDVGFEVLILDWTFGSKRCV